MNSASDGLEEGSPPAPPMQENSDLRSFFYSDEKKFCCVKSSSVGGNQVFSENRHPEKREEKTVQIETRAREVLLRRKTKPNKFFNMVRKLLSKTAVDKVHLAAPSTLLVTFASLPSH